MTAGLIISPATFHFTFCTFNFNLIQETNYFMLLYGLNLVLENIL
jgi:hypothetical protein